MRISSGVAHWTSTQKVMRMSRVKSLLLFRATAILLFYIIKGITTPKLSKVLYIIIVWLYRKWRQCQSHLRSSFVRHDCITDYSELR
jgi:hypothetical protein